MDTTVANSPHACPFFMDTAKVVLLLTLCDGRCLFLDSVIAGRYHRRRYHTLVLISIYNIYTQELSGERNWFGRVLTQGRVSAELMVGSVFGESPAAFCDYLRTCLMIMVCVADITTDSSLRGDEKNVCCDNKYTAAE